MGGVFQGIEHQTVGHVGVFTGSVIGADLALEGEQTVCILCIYGGRACRLAEIIGGQKTLVVGGADLFVVCSVVDIDLCSRSTLVVGHGERAGCADKDYLGRDLVSRSYGQLCLGCAVACIIAVGGGVAATLDGVLKAVAFRQACRNVYGNGCNDIAVVS